MPDIHDLNIRALIPVYDTTRNPDAREVLTSLLLELPGNPELIYKKQAVMKTLIHHGYHRTQLDYSPVDYGEVQAFLHRLGQIELPAAGDVVTRIFHYKTLRNDQYMLQGGLRQLIGFMDTADRYFSFINPAHFPDEFRRRLIIIQEIFRKMQLPARAVAARSGTFTAKEIRRLIQLFLHEITAGEWHIFWQTFNYWEAWLSLANAAVRMNMVFAEFTSGGFELKDFYHLLIKQPVRNSICTDASVLLLTGANMSGKSTLLKAMGCCVYLAHAGMPVPASVCRIPFYNGISAAINLRDDLQSGYSHFMMEVQQLKQTLHAAGGGDNCFAIFDELFRGTNADDATDISLQTIEGLVTSPKGFFIISTHLHALEGLLTPGPGWKAMHMACMLEEGLPRFAYQLQEGWGRLKIGRIIFEQEGLPAMLGQWKSLT
ncbi:DNA mismatch repair protein MutS [Chitinophaga jiangningensis]|uniref:DNA mismatch repair protein MutS n=1 Tax=Chitinophaga jiangningensis TaxID=1419482 RepID=A0A1M7FGM1_9BACT|nr:hypothetical protein [Chitinophaga jiangningensis]SHM03115.1 DNA mismatch repair protein MutS [Chitinophaga jiangningensis]